MECLVIGAGGVGVMTAFVLKRHAKCHVSLVVRSDYDHVVTEGYEIKSSQYGYHKDWKPDTLYKTVEEASKAGKFYDYVVVTTKNIPDGPKKDRVSEVARPVIESNRRASDTRRGAVLLIQNGIHIEKELIDAYPKDKYGLALLSGVQIIASTKVGRGVIEHKGQELLMIGSFDAKDEEAISMSKAFQEIYGPENSGNVKYDPDVSLTRWKKLMYNCSIAPVCTLTGLDHIRTYCFGPSPKATEEVLWRPAMNEIRAIAASEGVIVEPDQVDYFVNLSQQIFYKPSLCVDLENGRLMELEVLLGNPLKAAAANGVPAPVLSVFYNLLFLRQTKIKEDMGLVSLDNDRTVTRQE